MDTRQQGIVTAFIGTTPNIGTTLIALTSAVRLAEISQKRIAFLCLNLKSSKLHRYLGIEHERISLDELLPDLRSRSLDADRLHHAMHRYTADLELYVLFGNRFRETAEYYGLDELVHLIEIAKQSYDYVFIDIGAYWDNAGTIGGLLESESVVMVTTEALSHFQEDYYAWIGSMGKHIQLELKSLYHLIIKHRGGLFHGKQCKRELLGTSLPELEFPISLYEALDRGELKQWLHDTTEGSRWLMSATKQLFPEIDGIGKKQRYSWRWPRSIGTALSPHSKIK